MGERQHQLTIVNREKVVISGVLQVLNYDESELVLETTMGVLNLKGNKFNITVLSLETGDLEIAGRVNNLSYSEGKGVRSKKIWQRLLK
ncbi:MAG: sporulation protein YabP [Clostridia bacterium]|nr:sporulation protein YabP [Clostridia bacterium]